VTKPSADADCACRPHAADADSRRLSITAQSHLSRPITNVQRWPPTLTALDLCPAVLMERASGLALCDDDDPIERNEQSLTQATRGGVICPHVGYC